MLEILTSVLRPKAVDYNTCKNEKKKTFLWQNASFDDVKEPTKRNTP